MAEEEPKKVESESPSDPPPAPAPAPALAPAPAPEEKPATVHEEHPKDVTEEKSVIPTSPPPPAEEEKLDHQDSKALAVVENPQEPEPEKNSEGSVNRDAVLERVATEKRLSLIRAWEESEKSKVENKSHRKISAISAWENSRKASVEAELKKIEEQLEKKKAEYVETMKNKIALIHKSAEEKRAAIEAKRGEESLKAEELAAKHRAKGTAPKKKFLSFF